jgi:uncharacterized protein DUF3833
MTMYPKPALARWSPMRLLMLPLAFLSMGADFVPAHRDLARPAPNFVAEDFFAGRTEGNGIVKGALTRQTALKVRGAGHIERDGTLVLDQRIERQGSRPEQRQWRIRKLGPNRYAGTLSDAHGPVMGEVRGNCLHLRYRLAKGNMAAEQFIYLQPDGRTALNRMTVRKLGITVARIEETIRKVG